MIFPDPRAPTEQGIIAIGGDLEPETLHEAYRKGIFPWPQPDLPMLWFSPEQRGILDFAELHVPTSLKKFSRQHPELRFTINQAFSQVIEACRIQNRKDQNGTWILPEMQAAYQRLFERGWIISLECWEGTVDTVDSPLLIGGIYGVLVEGHFSGESMFHRKDNISKMCLWKLVQHLQGLGHKWMDIQMVTPVLAAFGGKYISREEFLQKLGL